MSDPLDMLPMLAAILIGAKLAVMFRAGLETDVVQIKQVGGAASLAAIGGVILPFGVAFC